jgi:hypothetical protein
MNNGGSAFPEIISDKADGGYDTYSYGGMSLLDYFAGQALAGLTVNYAHQFGEGITHEDISKQAYGFASAMLAERERKNSKEAVNVKDE